MNYFDTSAIVKRFITEEGSAHVEALLTAEPRLATSKVTYAEVHAGLARRLREGRVSAMVHRQLANRFDFDWESYLAIDLIKPLLALTRDLVRRHPLRGFDAIHLASAINLQSRLREPIQLVAADNRLLTAASKEGLEVADVRV